ncbi:MAG TPA: arsenite methyltransferase [Nitrososphaeraceae archaeon]|nr:arsenite methyltransferase [Nitrososphaeraceae archaeon]
MNDLLKIKEKVKQRYGEVALTGDSCCGASVSFENEGGCCSGTTLQPSHSATQVSELIGYSSQELKSIPEASILGAGCGTPTKFAFIKEGDTVVDLGSGAGVDVFIAANIVKGSGRVIGIDMTDEMLEKARKNAYDNGYANVEFRKGDIEERIPIDDNSVDVVISNCVINLTTDKAKAFSEIYRILKPNGIGRMVISDLVTDKQIAEDPLSIDPDKWCSCIDGALTKENYIASIKKGGFGTVKVLDEKLYTSGDLVDNRRITSLVIRAVRE